MDRSLYGQRLRVGVQVAAGVLAWPDRHTTETRGSFEQLELSSVRRT